MTIEEQFAKWWDESGKLALVADQPAKAIAFAAYRAAILAPLGIESVGHQYGFHSGQGATAWMEQSYYNGQRPYTSREIFTLRLPAPRRLIHSCDDEECAVCGTPGLNTPLREGGAS